MSVPFSYRWYWPRIKRAVWSRDWERAIRLARRWVRFFPRDPNAWRELGNILDWADRPAEALSVFEEGFRRHPRSPRLAKGMAAVLLSLGRDREAEEILRSLDERFPSSRIARLLRAEVAIEDGDHERAKVLAEEALDLEGGSDPWALHEAALILARVPGQAGRAIELWQRFVVEIPDEPLGHILLSVLLKERDPDASDRHLHRARRIYGGQAQLADRTAREIGDEFLPQVES